MPPCIVYVLAPLGVITYGTPLHTVPLETLIVGLGYIPTVEVSIELRQP